MALLAPLLRPFLLLCSDLRFLEIALVLPRGCQLPRTLLCPDSRRPENANYLGPCSAQTHASPRCQLLRTLLFLESRLPEIGNYLEPCPARTPASPRLPSASDPTLTGPKSLRDCQLPQTLHCPDSPQNCQVPRSVLCPGSRLPEIFKCLRPCSNKSLAFPRLSPTSDPALPRLPPPRDCQVSQTLLELVAGLPEIVTNLGPRSAQTPASPKLSSASGSPCYAKISASPRLPTTSGPVLPRLPPSQNYQAPRALLCPDSRLPKIANYLGPCSAPTPAFRRLRRMHIRC